ncbi:hypothetical protein QFZ70_003730 [Arthrobacter sp. V1I9]|uniref:hypothetical protein n=1 Tax=Arthrobacter sp. V1I9 TaxID=3042275 RepID=UPI002791ED55|nr:hypothetical protein [Arthrobacter sp. V1I9]MDQ0871257.1 hypothetical protein [Arthrobacter sp. V1I9]
MAGVRAVMVASALSLPLWAAACVTPPLQDTPPSPAPPLVDARTTPTPAAAPPVPAPQPQAPPPATAVTPPAPETKGGAPAAPAETAPVGTATAPAPEVPASEDPLPSAPAPSGKVAGPQTVTAYYVLLDDGGSNGVRFGCNDSLVGVSHPSSAGEDALAAAVRALLDAQAEPEQSQQPPEVYNALSESDLKFLSGSFDGTTVTVYLAGTLSMGGVCDLPRVEAQLTHTAVSAVGAIRAEIYVNGLTLAEALRLD